MSIVVIYVSLLGVSEYFIGFRGLFEILLSLFIAWIAVRVVFQGELPIICLEPFSRGISINTEDIVIVPLSDHRLSLECILTVSSFEPTNTNA